MANAAIRAKELLSFCDRFSAILTGPKYRDEWLASHFSAAVVSDSVGIATELVGKFCIFFFIGSSTVIEFSHSSSLSD